MSCDRGFRDDFRGGCGDPYGGDRFSYDAWGPPRGGCGPRGGGCFDGPPVIAPPVVLPPVLIPPGVIDRRAYYPQPMPVPYPMPTPHHGGGEWFDRGPRYSNDTVHGGPGGYYSNRERYDGGYSWGRQQPRYYPQPQPYYPQPQPYVPPTYGVVPGPSYSHGGNYSGDTVHGGPSGYYANRQRYDGGWNSSGYGPQYGGGGNSFNFRDLFDFGMRFYDARNAHDIARRY